MSSQGGRSREPEGQLGVFKRLADVPGRYRLSNHQATFEGRDVWAEFLAADDRRAYVRTTDQQAIDRVRREWTEFMADRPRHYALATPADVNEWVKSSLDRRALATTQHPYWAYIEGLYTWLQERTDYPHLYHPVRMAAVEYDEARQVWDYRCSHRDRGQ